MDESVAVGHPAEFFREVTRLFSSVESDMRMSSPDRKLELHKTPLEGVAGFEEALRGRCHYAVVRKEYRIAGALLVLAGLAGMMVEFLFFNVESFSNLLIVGGLFAVFLVGAIALGECRKQFSAELWMSFEGEAYQAKTVEPLKERTSVFSRALLKTGWLPSGKIPPEFANRMEENRLKLDLEIAVLLPQFELEPPKILEGKGKYYDEIEAERGAEPSPEEHDARQVLFFPQDAAK